MGRDSGENAVTEAREKSFNDERVVNNVNTVEMGGKKWGRIEYRLLLTRRRES